jgi:cyclopropane fatty-acyl-phospholipid synthase-like methyltransferase
VISIEMFEHMKNYDLLINKVATWLAPTGKLFVHIFTHRSFPSHYKEGWMTDNFFSGGTLPSDDLLHFFQKDLRLERRWVVNGSHYMKTQEAWLKQMDSKKAQIMPVLERTYGPRDALKWFVNWRLFFIVCSEFFGLNGGEEYIVSLYLFTKP